MSKLNLHERKILTLTCLGHFLSHFNMLVFPAVLLPLTSRLNLNLVDVLGLSFWMYLLFGITALPWGLAGDRWGVKKLFVVYYLGAFASGLVAAWGIDNPTILMIALSGLGFFSGVYHPTGLGWISKEFRQVSLGMAYNGMFGNLGLATAPLIAGIINWLWGPREVFIALALLNLSGLFLILGMKTSEKAKDQSSSTIKNGKGQLIAFLMLLVGMMLGGIEYRGLSVIIPSYLEIKNADLFQRLASFFTGDISNNLIATLITSLIFLVGMGGQYFGGHLASRYDLKLCLLGGHLVTVPAAFILYQVSNIPLVVITMVYFFFLLGIQPIENTLVTKYTPQKLRHSAFGFKFILTFGVGSLSVKVIGIIDQDCGLSYVFPFLGIVASMLVGVVILLILKTWREDHPQRVRA